MTAPFILLPLLAFILLTFSFLLLLLHLPFSLLISWRKTEAEGWENKYYSWRQQEHSKMLREVTKHGTIASRTCYSLVHALNFTFSLFILTLKSSERKGVSCNPVLSTAEGIFLLPLNSFPHLSLELLLSSHVHPSSFLKPCPALLCLSSFPPTRWSDAGMPVLCYNLFRALLL